MYYHIDDEPTPYLTEVHVPPDLITLGDVKRVLMRSNFKYYCKALDQDTGWYVFFQLFLFKKINAITKLTTIFPLTCTVKLCFSREAPYVAPIFIVHTYFKFLLVALSKRISQKLSICCSFKRVALLVNFLNFFFCVLLLV